MNVISIINQNFFQSNEFSENSFISQLHENCIWNENEYWKLDWAIYELNKEYGQHKLIPRDINWKILKIYSFTVQYFSYHFNANDVFEFKNIKEDEIYNWNERLELVFEGFFLGVMPKNNGLLHVNPLIK